MKRTVQQASVGYAQGMFTALYRGGLSMSFALVGGRTRGGDFCPGQIINVAQDQKGDILVPLPEEEGIHFGVLLRNNLALTVGVPLFVEGLNLFDDGPQDPSGAGSILELGPGESVFVTHKVGAGGTFGTPLLTAQKGQGATWAETHTDQSDRERFSGQIDVWRRLAEVPLSKYGVCRSEPSHFERGAVLGKGSGSGSRSGSVVGVGAGEVELLVTQASTNQFEQQAVQLFRCRTVTRDEMQSVLGLGDGVLWESSYSQQWWTQVAAIVPQQMVNRPKMTIAKRPSVSEPSEPAPIPGLVYRHPTGR